METPNRAFRGLALSLLLLAACEKEQLARVPEPEIHVDELKQKKAAQVDILWVVDNSGSMVEEQAALAANFDRFITGLTLCPGSSMPGDYCDSASGTCKISGNHCDAPDYHIGVVSTDVTSPADSGRLRKIGLCVPAAGATPSGAKYRYCQGSNQDCLPNAQDPMSDADNRVCDMANPGALTYVSPTTPNAEGAFARLVKVGTTGSGLEQGVRAAAQALGRDTDKTTGGWVPAPAENQGFLRDGASLFVIFVSDEDDSTFGETPYFYRAFETLKGAGNEGSVSVSAIVGDPDIDGPMGTARGGCPAPPAEAIATAGRRYVSLAMYSRGLSSEFRTCDDRRLTCPMGNACTQSIPELPGVCLAGTCQTDQDCANFKCSDNEGCAKCQGGTCSLAPSRFLEILKNTGVYQSICEANYEDVLSKLGFQAAGLARKFQLTRNGDCTRTVPCCAAGVDEASCMQQAAVCVRVNGQPVPNDRQTGWVYEASSNAVFFDGDFVPPADAEITVSYRLSRAPTPVSCSAALK